MHMHYNSLITIKTILCRLILFHLDSYVGSYNFGIAVFEKYFLLGNLYCGSNYFSRLAKPSFSMVHTGNMFIPKKYACDCIGMF